MDPMQIDDVAGSTNSGSGDIDPVDGGPSLKLSPPPLRGYPTSPNIVPNATSPTSAANKNLSPEEEARQAIDVLRGQTSNSDDVASRVAAASRLDAVAKVLGEERTRNVREKD